MKIVHSDKEYQAKHLEAILRYNASEKRKVDMKRLSHSVEVTNTLTNIKYVYSSKTEAASAIGCDPSTISIALKEFKEKGKYRLVKKIYLITLKECNTVKDEKSTVGSSYSVVSPVSQLNEIKGSNSKRVKVLDISNGNTTTYLSLGEAAKATGCHITTISKALDRLKKKRSWLDYFKEKI